MTNQMIQDIRTQAETNLAESRKDLNMVTGVIMECGFVVLSAAGFPLDFTTKGKVATNPVRGQFAGRVVRFTRKDAETIAAAVKDGNGKAGQVAFVRDAVLLEIAAREHFLTFIPKN